MNLKCGHRRTENEPTELQFSPIVVRALFFVPVFGSLDRRKVVSFTLHPRRKNVYLRYFTAERRWR